MVVSFNYEFEGKLDLETMRKAVDLIYEHELIFKYFMFDTED